MPTLETEEHADAAETGGLCQDELERTRAALREIEAEMTAVLVTAAEGVVTIDESGVIRTFNLAAERMFGWDAADVVGRNIELLIPAPYRGQHGDYLGRYLETDEKRVIGIGCKVAGLRRDGTVFPMHLAVGEVEHRRPRLFTGIVRDLSERERLERHLEEASSEERHRVARDLHDQLGGTMTGISILASILHRKLEETDSPEATRAAELAAHVRAAHEEVRRVARGLLPVADDPAGLIAALREVAVRTGEVHGIRCAFECERPLEVHWRTAANHIYMLVSEAVQNAVRHADATEVRIVCAVENGQAVFTVEDDGVGLPADADDSSGMGLRTMAYRAGLLDASLDARARPQGGTRVRCAVPLERLGGSIVA